MTNISFPRQLRMSYAIIFNKSLSVNFIFFRNKFLSDYPHEPDKLVMLYKYLIMYIYVCLMHGD